MILEEGEAAAIPVRMMMRVLMLPSRPP